MRMYRSRRSRRGSRNDGSFWLSFSDLMSCLLLIIILIMFYIMYQYFDHYETSMQELAIQQTALDTANAALEEERTRLATAESDLATAQATLITAQTDLATAQADLSVAQTDLETAQAALIVQQTELETAQALVTAQQAQLDDQQTQIESLIGLKPRLISSLSDALRAANINAAVDPASGAIILESDVLFSTGEYNLSDAGKASIDAFLNIYLSVLFSDEYRPYVAEVIVEGHTDSVGDYISNLDLSLQRAGAVASYILSDEYRGISHQQKMTLRSIITINGRSNSDPVLDARGHEDMDASRRVVFKFRLTDDQMVEQLRTILEADDTSDETKE
ncbi:MAG: OmpA family protein [Clostridia bacterium]|nr:OmpA family protein [Clostridia bacterium]